MKHGGRLLATILSLLAARGAAAVELAQSQRWRSIEVDARLDAQGDLRVEERQVLVLEGDWTVVERRFALPSGATLQVEAVELLDAGGALPPAPAPQWTQDDARLSWTVRAPGGPEFQGTEVGTRVRYRISGLLQAAGEGWRLAYDFAPQGRRGSVEAMRVRLTLAPEWRAGDDPLTLERRDVLSGQSVILRARLRWEGSGTGPRDAERPPSAAGQPFPPDLRGPLVTSLVFLLVLAGGLVWWYDFGRGLFNPLPPPDSIDENWLRENVLAFPPEVVGAAWDGRLGAPEVAAMLAELALSGMIEVRAGGDAPGGRRAPVLRLLVDRTELGTAERALVDAVFVGGHEIDRRALRRHHGWRDAGPAAAIATGVLAQAARLLPPGGRRSLWPWLLGAVLAAAGLLTGALAAARGEALLPIAATFGAALVLLASALAAAHALSGAMYPASRRTALFAAAAAPLVLGIAAVAWLASGGAVTDGGVVLAATLLWIGGVLLTAGTARTHLSPVAMARLRAIEAARLFFADELRAELPRLRDPWIPCLVALGLAREIDRWAAAHPGAAHPAAPAHVLGAHTFTGGAAHVAAASWAALVELTATRPWSSA